MLGQILGSMHKCQNPAIEKDARENRCGYQKDPPMLDNGIVATGAGTAFQSIRSATV